jgi:hypothetical protein
MAIQLGALRDALIDAGATPDKADRASEELAGYEIRLSAIDTRLTVLTWMVGTSVGLTIVLLGSMLAMWTKLGDIAGQLGQIARTIH